MDEIRTSNKMTGEKKTNVAVEMSIRHLLDHNHFIYLKVSDVCEVCAIFLGGWSIIYTCITYMLCILYSSFLHFTRQ